MSYRFTKRILALAASALVVGLPIMASADAQRGRGGAGIRGGGARAPQVRRSANANINHNANFNHNTNRNVNRDIDIDVHHDIDRDWDDHYHPIARAAAVTAVAATTAAIVAGSVVRTLPPACGSVYVGGLTYYQCSGYWYQPRYAGTTVEYVVVNPPR